MYLLMDLSTKQAIETLNLKYVLGAIFILRKDIGAGGWSRNGQFSLTLCSENVLT